MTKIKKTCQKCGADFLIHPSRQRWADARGTEVKFCSAACTGKARTDGDIKAKPRGGETVKCAMCGADHYRKRARMGRSKHFCSEPCRLAAISANLIDRRIEQASEKKRTGERFRCCICGTEKYQRRSYYARGVSRTCGNRDCISAYSRSLWNLPPFSENERKIPKGPSRRPTNFTAKQRVEWMGSACEWCGAVDNLCLDHFIPVCAGGQSAQDNAQTLCQPCNIRKSKIFDRPFAKSLKQLRLGG